MQEESQTPASDTQALLDFVAQREVPCPVCSYNLRGLTRPSCPECGNELKLRVGAESAINMAWLTILIALLIPSGVGLLSVAVLINELQYWLISDLLSIRDVEEACIIFSVLYCIVCIPLSALAIWMRRRFIRIPRRTQWTYARVFILLDIAILVFFLFEIFQ